MKKITILSKTLGVGGIEKYNAGLTKMLENDYELDLLITYKDNEPLYQISNKTIINYIFKEYITKEDLKKSFKRNFIIFINTLLKLLKQELTKKSKLKKQIKNIDSDYIITSSLYETKLVNKLLKNKKIVKIYTEHNYPNKCYLNRVLKVTSNYDKIILPNEEIKDMYKSQVGIKAECIPNFIEKIDIKKKKTKDKKLISVGKFTKEKDFLTLIDIMDLLVKMDDSITLTLIGDGKLKNEIKKKIKELNLEKHIILTGNKNPIEIEDELLNSALYVCTSLTESFGLSILEAMNCGLPIVSFDTPSVRLLLENNTGVLIENRDKILFANTIIELLNNKKEMSNLSKKSLEKVEDYKTEKVKKQWLNLLKSLENRSTKKVMFISSTGGHLNELLMLKSMFKKYPFMLITENTPTNKELVTTYGKKYTKYLVYGTRKHPISYPFKLLINVIKSFYYYILYRPKFIITTGAHTAGPMCLIGKLFRSKIIYIETFANSETKSLTGSIVYKFADLFIVQWESMLKVYDKAVYGGWIY